VLAVRADEDRGDVGMQLDQEGLGNPIESGEEVAEAEAEPDKGGRFQPLGATRVLDMAAVEHPDQRAEGQEQDRPGMNGRKGKNG
jgi:hypothetical protein